jgi:7-keto-8-aminopelargonate synthetase-like enzyme
MECGDTPVHRELEEAVATFLDKPAALVIGMGFATNSTLIPALCDPTGNAKVRRPLATASRPQMTCPACSPT